MNFSSETANDWKRMSLMPLERFELLDVRLPDGAVAQAIWTGTRWLSNGNVVTPTAWRVPAADSTIPEDVIKRAQEAIERLSEQTPSRAAINPAQPPDDRWNWFKRATFSVRNLLA